MIFLKSLIDHFNMKSYGCAIIYLTIFLSLESQLPNSLYHIHYN